MSTIKATVIRDGADLVVGFDAVPGLEQFGRNGYRGQTWVRCPKGERMPALAAMDWLRDEGFEVEAPAWFK